jgi:hypothetical protein
MLLVADAVTVLAAFSCMVKPVKVIKSPPIILKIPSLSVPAVSAALAVMVLEVPWMVIVFTAVPSAVITYPPAGAVSLPVSVITTGEVIAEPFNAVMALLRSGYVSAKPEPPFVDTCA